MAIGDTGKKLKKITFENSGAIHGQSFFIEYASLSLRLPARCQ